MYTVEYDTMEGQTSLDSFSVMTKISFLNLTRGNILGCKINVFETLHFEYPLRDLYTISIIMSNGSMS